MKLRLARLARAIVTGRVAPDVLEAILLRGLFCFTLWFAARWFPAAADPVRALALAMWLADVVLVVAGKQARVRTAPVRALAQVAGWVGLVAVTRLDGPFVLGLFVELGVAALRLDLARCAVAAVGGAIGLVALVFGRWGSGGVPVAATAAVCIALTGAAFVFAVYRLRRPADLEIERRRTAHLAHGIKNSLHGVTGFAALLDEDLPAGDPRRDLMQRIRAGLDDTAERVRELMVPRAAPTDDFATSVRAVVEAAVALHAAVLARNHIETHVDVDPRQTTTLRPEALRVIVVDLIENAVRAMQPDGGSLRFESRRQPAMLVARDTGPGIPPSLHDRIFEPGFTTRPDGTGFGLSAALAVLREAGGAIHAGRDAVRGAAIEILLPQPSRTGAILFRR